jgi:hypothetical protein
MPEKIAVPDKDEKVTKGKGEKNPDEMVSPLSRDNSNGSVKELLLSLRMSNRTQNPLRKCTQCYE